MPTDPTPAPSLDDLYDAAGYKYDVDPLRIKAHAIQESGEKANLPSADGKSWGFGQFKPETWAQVMPGVPLSARGNPSVAIDAMGKYLSQLDAANTDANGNVDVRASTAAYNGSGPAADAYAQSVQGIYGKLVKNGGLKTSAPPTGTAANDDAFGQTLKGSPAPAAATAPAADDAFGQTLKGGPATPAPTAPPPDPVTDSEGHLVSDTESPLGVLKRDIAAIAPAAGRIGSAVAQGWNIENPLMSPKLQQIIEANGPGSVGYQITSPLLQAGGAVLRGANALGSGASAAIGEGGNALLPGLGRDLNMLAQVAPLAHVGTGAPLTPAGAAPEAAAAPKFVSEHYAPPPVAGGSALDRINQLIAHDDAETTGKGPQTQTNLLASPVAAPPAGPGAAIPSAAGTVAPDAPTSGMQQAWVQGLQGDVARVLEANKAAGVPSDLSAAATPEQLATLTTEQMKAYRRVQELKDVLSPPVPGMDKSTYVAGSLPTEAEYSGNPSISQKETVVRQRNPDQLGAALAQNNVARVKAVDDLAGTSATVQGLREAQRESAEADTARILRTARPADLQPALDTVNNILNDPRLQERDAIRKVLTPLRDAMYDADGNLKTDPQSVWGMHDNITDKLQNAKNETSTERFVVGQLNQVKQSIDGVMNTATGKNFQTFLDNQSGYLKQINAQELLQKFQTTMTNKNGEILPDRFHRFVTDLAVKRGMPGVNAAMDIPDSTMAQLINIDKDLKRAGNIDLGKVRGSPTNLFFEVAQAIGLAGVHAGVAVTGAGGFGNVMAQQALHITGNKLGRYRLNKLTNRALAPPPGGYEPYQPPGQY